MNNIYEIQERKSSLKTKWKEIEIPASGIKSIYQGNWCQVFVYSNKGNFILKGFLREINEFIKKVLIPSGYKFFANITSHRTLTYGSYGENKLHSNRWIFYKKDTVIIEKQTRRYSKRKSTGVKYFYKEKKWIFRNKKDSKFITFKRLPKKWVPELDEL
jgi:hypothetical protein